jgi:MFS family permease
MNLSSLFPQQPSRPMLILLSLVFMKQVGNGMVWSVIALYGQSLGASTAVIGMMISAYGGARLVVNMPAGYASEKFGRRAMMSLGCGVSALASLAVVATSEVPAFFLCLLVMGAASATFMTSALAAVADLGTPGKRMQDASYYQAANMIGASMGPALGGLAAGLWGFGSPYLINGIIALAGMLAFAAMPWRQRPDKHEKPLSQPGELCALARQGMGVGIMYFAIFYVRVSSNWILLPLIAQTKHGMELTTIGLILTCGALANLSVIGITPPLARLCGRVWIIVIASGLTLTACALLAFGEHRIYLWFSSILFGAGAGMASPTLIAYVADIAPEHQRGPAMGLLRTMQDLALILGPMFTGILADNLGLGYQGGLYGCLALLGGATIIFRASARNI